MPKIQLHKYKFFSVSRTKLDVLIRNARVRAQSCRTLCDPVDCSPPGSSVHGVFQARTLERVAISFSRGSSRHSDQSSVSCVSCVGRWVTSSASWEARNSSSIFPRLSGIPQVPAFWSRWLLRDRKTPSSFQVYS